MCVTSLRRKAASAHSYRAPLGTFLYPVIKETVSNECSSLEDLGTMSFTDVIALVVYKLGAAVNLSSEQQQGQVMGGLVLFLLFVHCLCRILFSRLTFLKGRIQGRSAQAAAEEGVIKVLRSQLVLLSTVR